jgi:hypothetical protein
MNAEKMDAKRMGEIALALVKNKMRHGKLEIPANISRELGNASKETGIPVEELKEFYRIVLGEYIEKIFTASNK